MTRKTRKIVIGAAAVAAVALVGLWLARPAAVTADLAVVTRGLLRVTLDEDGQTRALHHVTVSAPVSGRLLAVRLEAGDSVARGDPLLTMVAAPLDPRSRDQAEAALRAADAGVSQARSGLAVAQLAMDEAQRALARAEELHRSGAVSDRDLESAERLRDTRVRGLEMARDEVAAAEAQRTSARAGVEGASAASAPEGSRVVVRSPVAGRVLRVFEEHDRLVPAGTALMDVGDPRDLEVVVDVLSSDAQGVRVGAPMFVHVGEGVAPVTATVTRIEPAAFTKLSPLGVQEQRVNVHGAFASAPAALGDAYQVSVSIVLWQGADVLRVPGSALVAADGGWRVFRVRGGRAESVAVVVGHRGMSAVEVVSGLAAGDTVVARPNDLVRDGVRVKGMERGGGA
ncbi:MAG TPA: HlyD family efflux transporter periplasmic adaptor subunit [Gemmatimonadaceae bacterium]|nr:HlyD family efflux transporter periplasmic adaptor subunit [Gemmatimonadaceae bacterium]